MKVSSMESQTSLAMQTNSPFDDCVRFLYPMSWKTLRGRRGRLAQLPDLPLDILLEIFGHLEPVDLLRLARSYKKMRSFLMNQSMSWVWKRARSNVEGLPDCPPNMSEPAYANLVFSAHCHYCGFEQVSKIIWSTRDRACKNCFPKHYEQKSRVLAPESPFWVLPPEARKYAQVTGAIIHNPAFQPITSRDIRRQIFNIDILRSFLDEHALMKNEPLLIDQWLTRIRDDYEVWNSCMPALIEWHENKLLKRKGDLDAARKRRFEAVCKKLSAAGWDEELGQMNLDLLRNLAQVKAPKDLTERIWNGIGPGVITFMEEIRATRLEKMRAELITTRRMAFARYMAICDTRYPITIPIAELSMMEPFRSIIENTPTESRVTGSSFPPPPQTYAIFCHWQNGRKHVLVNIMKKSTLVPWNADIKHLDLATTFFRCQGPATWEPIGQWQGIITHPGAFARRLHAKHASPAITRLFDDFQQEFWNSGNRISFHEPAHLNARSIVATCGFDPDTTTAGFMDKYNPILECLSCGGDMKRFIMTWRRGVVHAIEHANLCKLAPQWIAVHPTEAWHAQALAQIAAQPAVYRCHMCDFTGDSRNINSHIKSCHIVRQRVTLTRQPPLAITINLNISPKQGRCWDLFCHSCNSFRQNFGDKCWNCGVFSLSS